jgi:hypothetical protein
MAEKNFRVISFFAFRSERVGAGSLTAGQP